VITRWLNAEVVEWDDIFGEDDDEPASDASDGAR
jgi:hypothetical protein